MQYYFRYFSPIVPNKVFVSAEEFTSLKEAVEILHDLLKLTENYSVLVESYRKVELAKFEAELDHVLYSSPDYLDFFNADVALSSPISGYLSCSRYFLDSTNKIYKRLFTADDFEEYKQFVSKIYDSNVEYRFTEALRNYVQHSQLPIDTTKFNNFREPEIGIQESELVTCVSIYARKSKLNQDKDFKRKTLENLPEEIDIIESIRVHMECLWQIYNHISKKLNHLSERYRPILDMFISKFKNETGTSYSSFYACEQNTDGEEILRFTVTTAWDDARQQALSKLGNLINLRKRYITGKIRRLTMPHK